MAKIVNAESLSAAWRKYMDLFGEQPHGTVQQLAAVLEFVHDDDFIVLPLESARLLNNGFMPLNPNKLRNADPEVKRGAIEFKSLVAQKLRVKTKKGGGLVK